MISYYAFIVLAVFTVGAAIAMFFQRSLLRSVTALTLSFVGSAVIFYIIGQDLIALLQLLVFVGGLSTYLIIAVSSENREVKKLPRLMVLAIIFTAGLSIVFVSPFAAAQNAADIQVYAATAFNNYYQLLFVIALALFGAAMASVLVIRKFVRLVV